MDRQHSIEQRQIDQRKPWERLWAECAAYAFHPANPFSKDGFAIWDATAAFCSMKLVAQVHGMIHEKCPNMDIIDCLKIACDLVIFGTSGVNVKTQGHVPLDQVFIWEDAHGLPCTDNENIIGVRWLKAPGEVYGRSPVMKALPDIKTANKVAELILKNAPIAVTGNDDGGVEGAIIPKAVDSAGLTPLEAPGNFDLSQLILQDLRKNIRRALLVEKLGQPEDPRMTATEVLERSADMARLLGATYGRLQSELFNRVRAA